LSATKYNLTQGKEGPILVRLTLPMMLGIISMVAFNLIDTYYVGKLGKDELAALSYTFPVIMVIFSLVQGIGIGATALISKSIGAGNLEKARRETSDSLMLGLILAFTLSSIGLFTIEPVFTFLGAGPDVLLHITDYMQIWFITVIVLVVPFVGNSAIRATGDAKTPAYIMLFAVAVNAALDPLLIFGIGPFPELGLKGAALATSISRALTLVLSLYILYVKKSLITFHLPSFTVLKGCWASIIRIGLPSGVARMLTPIAMGKVTAILSSYGAFAVAAFGVGSRIEFLTMSVLFALAASLGPFTGQNFGAQRIGRIRKAVDISAAFAVVWGLVMAVLLYFLGEKVANIFSESEDVVTYSALYLSIVPFSFGFQGINQCVNTVINTLNKPMIAFVISLVTMFGIMIPLAILGSNMAGIKGMFYGLATTYLLAGVLSYIANRWLLARLLRATKSQEIVK